MSDFPKAHFGHCGAPLPDWREGADDVDPDDEELAVSPPDVVAMLGFDPLDLDESGSSSPHDDAGSDQAPET